MGLIPTAIAIPMGDMVKFLTGKYAFGKLPLSKVKVQEKGVWTEEDFKVELSECKIVDMEIYHKARCVILYLDHPESEDRDWYSEIPYMMFDPKTYHSGHTCLEE